MDKSEIVNFRMLQRRGHSLPSMDPQVWLFNVNDILPFLWIEMSIHCQCRGAPHQKLFGFYQTRIRFWFTFYILV